MSLASSMKEPLPPIARHGGGDVTVEQRRREEQALVFKTPYPPRVPRHASLSRATSVSDVRSGGRCPVSKGDTPRPSRCTRRAISLEDRKPRVRQEDVVLRLSQRKRYKLPTMSARAACEMAWKEKLRLDARRVCQVLILNAWRKRRTSCEHLRLRVGVAAEKLNGLRRQAETLRTLLDAEKTRVSTATEEIKKLNVLIAETKEDCDKIEEKNTEFKRQTESLEERIVKVKEDRENMKNSQFDALNQHQALDTILEKERRKLVTLRKEMTDLQVQLGDQLTSLEVKTSLAKDLELEVNVLTRAMKKNEELLQAALAETVITTEDTQIANEESVVLDEETERVITQEERLQALVEWLEQELLEKDAEKNRLGEDIQMKVEELAVVSARLALRREACSRAAAAAATSWGARLRRVLASVVAFPVTILAYLRHLHGREVEV